MSELEDKKAKFLAQFSPSKDQRVAIVSYLLETDQITPQDVVKDRQDNIVRYKKHRSGYFDINYIYPHIINQYDNMPIFTEDYNDITITARRILLQTMIHQVTSDYLTDAIRTLNNED